MRTNIYLDELVEDNKIENYSFIKQEGNVEILVISFSDGKELEIAPYHYDNGKQDLAIGRNENPVVLTKNNKIDSIPKSPVVPDGFIVKIHGDEVELLQGEHQLIWIEDNEFRFSRNIFDLENDLDIDTIEACLWAFKYKQRPTHKNDANLKPWELEAVKAGWTPPTK